MTLRLKTNPASPEIEAYLAEHRRKMKAGPKLTVAAIALFRRL